MLTAYVHKNIDPDIIFHASMFEYVDDTCGNFIIPNYVLEAFSTEIATAGLIYTYGTAFNYKNMCYDYDNLVTGHNHYNQLASYFYLRSEPPVSQYNTPDITQVEAQMWFYFLATQFIDAGIEALHMGDVFNMDYFDRNNFPSDSGVIVINAGHANYWNLTSKIRSYAATHARRGIVLFDGTLSPEFYYDPVPTSPVPNWHRQLIMDYLRNKIPYSSLFADYSGSNPSNGCSDFPIYYPTVIHNTGNNNDSTAILPLYVNIGGFHPQQWFCMQSPFYLDFDNTELFQPLGCAYQKPYTLKYGYQDYGYDDCTWFAVQSPTNRNLILQYTYYRIKEINRYGHLKMPGRMAISQLVFNNVNSTNIYRANSGNNTPGYTGFGNQQITIKALWNGYFTQPSAWLLGNLTFYNLLNGPDIGPASNLLFVGSNMIFYIGTDEYVHGYIQVNEYNNGTWLTVSPSYAAEIVYAQSVTSQSKAQGDLVASPDGSLLLYTGVDFKIHAFIIVDRWTYYYLDIFLGPHGSLIEALYGSFFGLIFPKNDRIYMVAYKNSTSELHICGLILISGNWQFIDITELSGATSTVQPNSKLTYLEGSSYDQIYYIGIDGYMYYYSIINVDDHYIYSAASELNVLLASYDVQLYNTTNYNTDLAFYINHANGNIWLYFVATNNSTGNSSLLCATLFSGSWALQDLTFYSIPNFITTVYDSPNCVPIVTYVTFNIAISPDGTTIAFFGLQDGNIYLYLCYFDGLRYYFVYNEYWDANTNVNSLQFLDNDTLFYIDPDNANSVMFLSKSEIVSNNPCLNSWPLCTCPPSSCTSGSILNMSS